MTFQWSPSFWHHSPWLCWAARSQVVSIAHTTPSSSKVSFNWFLLNNSGEFNSLYLCEADDISRGDAADSSQLINNAAVLRYRRSLGMDPGRSCTSMSGSPGYCTTLYSCYPNLSQSQLSIQEIGMIVARSKCQYLGVHDEQVNSSSILIRTLQMELNSQFTNQFEIGYWDMLFRTEC